MESKSHVKELLSHTVIYGFGILLNKSVGFILLPIYTKYFSPEQLGLFILIQSISLFLGVIYAFGIETSFMKYFIDAKSIRPKSEIYSSSIVFLFFSSLLLSIVIFIASGNISSYFKFENFQQSKFLIQILSIFMIIDTLYRFPLLLLRAELRPKTYAYINILTFVVNVICNIIFIIILRMGIEAIFYCNIIAAFVTFIVGILITSKYLTLKISFDKIKELFIYGNKFIYIGLFLILIDMSDRFFLKYFFDESVVGIYSANYRLASVMGLLIAAFKFSWTPYFLNLSSNPDNKKIISTIFTYFIFAGSILFLIFALFIKEFVQISIFGFNLLDIKYWSGLDIIPIVLLAYFFSGLFFTLNAAPFFTNNTGSILAITFAGLLINLLFNFLLIPTMGMVGAALSTLITYFSMFLIIYYYSQKIYKINYDWSKIVKLSMLSIVVFAICFAAGKVNMNTLSVIVINLLMIGLYLFVINSFRIIELKKINLLWKK